MIHGHQSSVDPCVQAGDARLETVIIGGTELFREGLRRLLAPKGFEVVFAESRLAEASRSGGPPAPPAIVILSSEPRVALTVDEVRAVRERFPCSALICVCSDFDEEQVVPLLECGVSAILTRTTGVDTLVQAVELALMGHRVVPCLPPSPAETAAPEADDPEEAGPDASPSSSFRPSPREVRIIACLVRGESNRDIARQLAIPVGRVKGHVKAILRKMRVQNRTQAAVWGMKNRLGGEGALAAEDESDAEEGDPGLVALTLEAPHRLQAGIR
jgi:two-component system nitrate/nitrite response regulator NarL